MATRLFERTPGRDVYPPEEQLFQDVGWPDIPVSKFAGRQLIPLPDFATPGGRTTTETYFNLPPDAYHG